MNRRKRQHTTHHEPDLAMLGFTLIELLVVVAIVSVLIAILLPALGMARKTASSTKCLVSLRNAHQAMATYSNMYDDAWPNVMAPETKIHILTLSCTQYDLINSFDQMPLWIGLLDEAGVLDIFEGMEGYTCPTVYHDNIETYAEINPQVLAMKSYVYSPGFYSQPQLWDPDHPERREDPESYRATIKQSQVAFPDAKVLLFEFLDNHGDGQLIGTPYSGKTRHSNVVFADGHVSRVNPADAHKALPFNWSHFYGDNMPDSFPFSCAPWGIQGRDF